MYKIRSSRKIDSRRLFTREYDFPKTLSLTENQFSGKAYLYTIRPCALQPLFGLHDPLPDAIPQVLGRGGGGGGRGHEEEDDGKLAHLEAEAGLDRVLKHWFAFD